MRKDNQKQLEKTTKWVEDEDFDAMRGLEDDEDEGGLILNAA